MSEEGSVLWKGVNSAGIHPVVANPLSVGLAPAPNNFGLSWGALGAGEVEWKGTAEVVLLS